MVHGATAAHSISIFDRKETSNGIRDETTQHALRNLRQDRQRSRPYGQPDQRRLKPAEARVLRLSPHCTAAMSAAKIHARVASRPDAGKGSWQAENANGVTLTAAIGIVDGAFAIMAIPTMVSALWLAPRVKAAAVDYFARLKLEKPG